MNNITKVNELIVYRKRREPALGVLSSISDRKISLFCEDGKEHSIDIKKILLNTGIIFSDKLNRSEKKLELRKYRKNLEAVKSEVDLKIIWECFGETPYQVKFTEIIELYFGDTNISEIEKLNLFWAIDKDVIYFTRLEDGYMPNSKDEIDKKIELSRVKKEKEKHRESAVKWAKSILNEEIEPKINNHFKDFIDLIEGYALNLDRYDRAKEAKEFLHDIKLKDIESAVEFLIKIGVWNENDDQISRKYYSSSFTSKRSQKELEELLNLDQSLNGFKDHTDLAIYSIDDKGTADIDDAISVELNEDKIILGIHISNVARFISKEGFLDNEAQNRGETVYFPEIVFDMFPHSLVEVKLTLNSGSKRLAISLFATFEKSDYKLVEYHFEQSIINVKKNLTYEEAEKTLTKTEWGKELIDLSMHLREKRIRNGAFIVQLPELKISFDENNEMSINKNYMISLPHKVVSECMILMNRLTAEYFKTNEIPALFRSQTQQIDEQAYELDPKDVLFPTKVTKFLKPTRVVLSSKPHKSLGIDCYVQVTSPIRRYMDVILQRQLIGYLTNGEICYSEDELESIFTKVSLNVREIKNSQKSRHRFWLLKHFLISDIKKAVGYVSSVKDKRASVYIPEFLMELPLSNFGGKKYKEGEKLEVEFYNIDPLRRRISIKPVIK